MSKTITPTEALSLAGEQLRAHLENYLDALRNGNKPEASFITAFDNCVLGYENETIQFYADFRTDDDRTLTYIDTLGIGSDIRIQEWYDMTLTTFREFMDAFDEFLKEIESDNMDYRKTIESTNLWLNKQSGIK